MAKILRMLLFLSTPSARRATRIRTAFHLDPEKFLSTPSARRATRACIQSIADKEFLSTPSARRATDGCRGRSGLADISIHALREEGDLVPSQPAGDESKFLSTPSARRATASLPSATSR